MARQKIKASHFSQDTQEFLELLDRHRVMKSKAFLLKRPGRLEKPWKWPSKAR
jgi:hypothetical protein